MLISILLRVLDVYSTLLVIYALLSWFPNAYDTILGRILIRIVNPILVPFKKLNLVFMGLDFTILIVILLIKVISMFLVSLIF